MRFRRGKIIAVALLCVISALFLSGFSALWLGLQNTRSQAGTGADESDYTRVPGFDDLYQRVPFADYDKGEAVISQMGNVVTSFTLRDECYRGGSLYTLLNAESEASKLGFSAMQNYRLRDPYPLFTNAEMQQIINQRVDESTGERIGEVEAPVIMLDPLSMDNVVVFELLNLTNPPSKMVMKHDGADLIRVELDADVDPDKIYGGVEVELSEGYDIVDEDTGEVIHVPAVYANDVGAVAYNRLSATTIRGMFNQEGYYEFEFVMNVSGADGMLKPVDFTFSFYIVHKANYDSYPRFATANRAVGKSEIYNYSYGSEYPAVRYDDRYFDVKVESLAPFTHDGDKFQFYNIGDYKMTSTLMYSYKGEDGKGARWLPVSRYRSYTSILHILGFQGYYGGNLPFYDATDSTNSSDITAWVNEHGGERLPFLTNQPHVSDALTYAASLVYLLESQAADERLTPVKTNFPPVRFMGNVDYATGWNDDTGENVVLATQAFHGINDYSGATKQWRIDTFDISRPLSTPGEYLITIYFCVNDTLCWQNFYFEITNSVDLKFAVGDEVLTLDQLVRNQLYSNQDVTVMFKTAGSPLDEKYEVPPTLQLFKADLDSTEYNQKIDLKADAAGNINIDLSDGRYRLVMAFGADAQAVSVVEVVVDREDAGEVVAVSSARRMQNLPRNTAVFGMGEVSLQWGAKRSGVGYKRVTVTHYRMGVDDQSVDPNADRNKGNYGDGSLNLFSASSLSAATSVNSYTPTKTESGWALDATFSKQGAGLYEIMIEDDLGNLTPFVLVIDNSKPTFTQNFTTTSKYVNVTDFPQSNGDPISIGYGKHKLVATLNNLMAAAENDESKQKVYHSLQTLAEPLIVEETREEVTVYALSIPLASVEISEDSGNYYEIDLTSGYRILNEEHTYYFRVTDVLGNVSEYYVLLTHDRSRGMVLAESTAKGFDKERGNRGFIAAEPNASTSLVTAQGGMTNRSYVTFSFEQAEYDEKSNVLDPYRVKEIKLEYYPLNFDESSPNYPFAKNPVNFLNQPFSGMSEVYRDSNSAHDPEGLYRIALYNEGEITPAGLYVITREYITNVEVLPDNSDQTKRQYWFIVDRTGMLDYNTTYQTQLAINFGSKLAKAKNFFDKNNSLSSNLPADITGFAGKYPLVAASRYPVNTFLGLSFPSLIPRFSVTNNGQTQNIGEGVISRRLGDTASDDITYRLVVADNARSFSISLFGGSSSEILPDGPNQPTSANYGSLNLFLDTGHGTKAWLVKNNVEIANTQMEFTREANGDSHYVYAIDPDNLADLEFRFENDPEGFYADVDIPITESSWVATGFATKMLVPNVHYIKPTGYTNTIYAYDIKDPLLFYETAQDGYSVSVTLTTEDGDRTIYEILFDTQSPDYNINRIKAQDNLACTLESVPDDYIYGLRNDFIFERDNDNRYLGTKQISYREVSANEDGQTSAVTFNLDSGIYFSKIVDLQDNEVKYYRITEQDYAGHNVSYIVQLQGKEYKSNISFVGMINDENDNLIRGIEMRVRESSVTRFWEDNYSFKIVCGDDEYANSYTLLSGEATWYINGVKYTDRKNKQTFIKILNKWIDDAAEHGEKWSYKIYDRIGAEESFECYNIRESSPKLQLEAYTEGGSSVYLQTTNYDSLSPLMTNAVLADKFQIEVIDRTKPGEAIKIPNVRFSMPVLALHNFDVSPDQELEIRVRDPFGRESITEYHGQNKNALSFTAFGNTVTKYDKMADDEIIYVGDNRGVELQFLNSVYFVNVYDINGNPVSNFSTVIIGNTTTYYFRPTSQADTTFYRVQAVGQLSGAILFEQAFAFDTRLPEVRWYNASNQTVDVSSNPTFTGTINLQVIANKDLFNTTVSYTRTYDGTTEKVALRPTNSEFVQFDQPGQYTVTLRSEIWATDTYQFIIASINNALVTVLDENVEIQASPIMLPYYNEDTKATEYIKNYMFTNQGSVGEDYAENGLTIMPSPSTNRILLGQDSDGNYVTDHYYAIDHEHNALIWCLAIPALDTDGHEIYTSKYFFATTGISTTPISNSSAVNLIVNGDDVKKTNQTYEIRTDLGQKGGLTVSLNPGRDVDLQNGGVPYNQYVGNIITVDCYRNGKLIKNLSFNEEFTINEFDTGYYEFIIHDLVDNRLMFGNNEQDRYVIVNLSRPMVLINNDTPVNDLIYNDYVEFKINDVADDLLKAHYNALYGEDFFNQYFYISDFLVERDEQELTQYTLEEVTTKTPARTYTWNTKGKYSVKLTYVIGNHVEVKGQYKFEIVSSGIPMQNYSLSVYPDIQVLSVKKNNYPVAGYNNLVAGDTLTFSADRNPGRYEIVLQSDNGIDGKKLHTINFNIGFKSNLNSDFNLSATSGGQTQNAVTLSYRSVLMYMARGDITIYLFKDGALANTVTINSASIQGLDINDMQTLTVSDAGAYSVIAYDAEGAVVYTDSWVITKTESPLAAIITAVVAGIAGIGLLIFIRMRRKMSVK